MLIFLASRRNADVTDYFNLEGKNDVSLNSVSTVGTKGAAQHSEFICINP